MLAMIETHFSNHGKTGMIETTRILCRKSCEIILPALYAIVKRKGEENLDVSRRLNAAIEYVEQHITEELDYQKLAQLAGCSAYNTAMIRRFPLRVRFRRFMASRQAKRKNQTFLCGCFPPLPFKSPYKELAK